jgi:hypothetical protein
METWPSTFDFSSCAVPGDVSRILTKLEGIGAARERREKVLSKFENVSLGIAVSEVGTFVPT